MAINTTARLALTKDDATENYNVGRVNANTDKIDEYMGDTVCTSSTRPSTGLFNGRIIYETDTQASLVYRTALAAWRYKGIPIVAGTTARDALTPKHDGLQCYRTDRDWVEIWNGSAWRPQGSSTLLRGKKLSSSWIDLGGGELDLFDMALLSVPVEINKRVIFHVSWYVNSTTTSAWLVRWRKTTALSGLLLGQRMVRCEPAGTADNTIDCRIPWNPDETATLDFRVSVERFGSSLLDINSANNSCTWVTLEDGPSGAWQ